MLASDVASPLVVSVVPVALVAVRAQGCVLCVYRRLYGTLCVPLTLLLWPQMQMCPRPSCLAPRAGIFYVGAPWIQY